MKLYKMSDAKVRKLDIPTFAHDVLKGLQRGWDLVEDIDYGAIFINPDETAAFVIPREVMKHLIENDYIEWCSEHPTLQ